MRAVIPALAALVLVAACDSSDSAVTSSEPGEPTDTSVPVTSVAPPDSAVPDSDASDGEFEWPAGGPSELGFDVDVLRAGLTALEAQDSNAHHLVVIREGRMVIDAALWPSSHGQPHDLASLTKSVVSLVVGAAIERGDIESLGVPLGELLEVPAGAAVSTVPLGDLLGMRAGLDCSADDAEAELQEMTRSPNYIEFASGLSALGEPGQVFAYCSPGYHLVSAAIGSVAGTSLAQYADDVLFEPLGILEWDWPSDPQGVSHGWGDLALRPVDLARLGQLVLDDGRWGGDQVLPPGYAALLGSSIATADPSLGYGLGWWLPQSDVEAALEGIGRGGQVLLVRPDDEIIVVVTGAETDGRSIALTVATALHPAPVDDPDADAEIAARLDALAKPPAPAPATTPDSATQLEQWFDLEANPLGLTGARVEQTSEAIATVSLSFDGAVLDLPVGLDGVAGLAGETPTGGPVAMVGDWDGTVLTVDYEETHGPDHWMIAFDLGTSFTMTVTDLAETFEPVRIAGSPAD